MLNPYKIGNKETKVPQKIKLTDAQIANLIKGYEVLPSTAWSDIPVNTHIRYTKRDGSFVRGGFVINHWARDGKQFIHVANNIKQNTPNYIAWPVAHETIQTLYAKSDKPAESTKLTEVITQINKIVDVVKKQQQQIDRITTELKRR
jgi:hypothetical protein